MEWSPFAKVNRREERLPGGSINEIILAALFGNFREIKDLRRESRHSGRGTALAVGTGMMVAVGEFLAGWIPANSKAVAGAPALRRGLNANL